MKDITYADGFLYVDYGTCNKAINIKDNNVEWAINDLDISLSTSIADNNNCIRQLEDEISLLKEENKDIKRICARLNTALNNLIGQQQLNDFNRNN